MANSRDVRRKLNLILKMMEELGIELYSAGGPICVRYEGSDDAPTYYRIKDNENGRIVEDLPTYNDYQLVKI